MQNRPQSCSYAEPAPITYAEPAPITYAEPAPINHLHQMAKVKILRECKLKEKLTVRLYVEWA